MTVMAAFLSRRAIRWVLINCKKGRANFGTIINAGMPTETTVFDVTISN